MKTIVVLYVFMTIVSWHVDRSVLVSTYDGVSSHMSVLWYDMLAH